MTRIEPVRTEEAFRAKAEAAWNGELIRAKSAGGGMVSAKAAALFLSIHADTLGEWRRRIPPMGPRFQKASGSALDGPNQRVKYDYEELVAWKDGQQGRTAKERRLSSELERLNQQQRELQLERQIHEAKVALEKLRKNAGRYAALVTSHEGWATSHAWAVVEGLIAGHVLTVGEDTLDRALADGEIWDAPLADALLEPWISVEARDPFDDAMKDALAAFQRALDHTRNQDRARGLEDRLPPPTAPESTRKPFRF
ncbi:MULTISPECIES: nucleotide-binding protein [Xanthomonas]|uniref:Nucleotide-binding protein n=1 Tax=Xanthomonas dyei TaxID=743699 RepID=A0ABZ0DBR8_9XANT|nr:nucleotide-binding protein [Xanthomonas dyei]WOB27713.1 nucleotide-binding protein [Xanthomonas dyei]WOB55335.1 nucleotide-binding protein [Xanthomonas dyei]